MQTFILQAWYFNTPAVLLKIMKREIKTTGFISIIILNLIYYLQLLFWWPQ